MRSAARGSLWLVALLATSCSTPPGGPTLRQLAVHAGLAGGPEQNLGCVQLPVLIGSHVDARKTVDAKFEVSIDATRDGVDVRFENGNGEVSPGVSVRAEDLRAGYSREITVKPESTDEYTVRLSSDCSEGDGAADGAN